MPNSFTKSIKENFGFLLSLLVYLFAFIIDLIIPLGLSQWVLYFLPILLNLPLKPLQLTLLPLLGSVLIIVGLFLSPPGSQIYFSILNRSVGILVLWLSAFFFKRRQQAESQRKAALQALKRAEHRYRELVRLAPAGIYEIDFRSRRFISVNEAMCRMLGYSREELLEMDPLDILDEEGQAHLRNRISDWLNGKEPERNVEYKVKTKAGKFLDVLLEATFTADEAGRPRGATVVGHDVTERKQAKAALEESEKRYKALVAASSEVLYRMSPDWSEMRQLYSRNFLSNTESPRRNWLQAYIYPEDQPKMFAAIRESIQKKSNFELEHRVMKADSSVGWTLSRAIPLLDDNGNIIEWFGAASDITERKKAEEILRQDKEKFERLVNERSGQLLRAQRELDKAHRLSEIGQLASTVAHELRNPLAAIRMAATNIERKISKGCSEIKLERHLENIEKKVLESDQIINNLLFYSRLRMPHWEKVNISTIINESLEMAKARHPDYEVDLRKDLSPIKNVNIDGDAQQLKELFNNIINNAFDSLGDKQGTVEIKAEEKNGKMIEIKIRDTGKGISPEDLKMIFEPFYSTKARGTGLGLTVSRQIVELHNGKIDVESRAGQGTIISVSLPLKQAESV